MSSLDLSVLAATAWPSTMPPPQGVDWRVDSTFAALCAAKLTRDDRNELLDVAADCKRYLSGGMSSTERARQPARRGRVTAIARRIGADAVITEAINAATREPDLGSVERHQVRGTAAACQMLLRLHVAAVCHAGDA